jgi:ADP-ribosylglycohydrolase/catechol 2,3-dioxygenase-like lactoylglutathione lyase family enzyme
MAPAYSELTRPRAHGAMLGLAVGDALGWPIEDRGGRVGGTAKLRPELRFMEWRRREGGRFAPHEQIVRAGEYSDDTQLALAVARSRTLGEDWWSYLTRVELPLWTTYERGGGGATKRAAQAWLQGRAPWEDKHEDAVRRYFAAGGNGAVMRCLAHCLVWPAHDPEARNRALDLDGLATHGHPRALLGSRLYAAAVDWALHRDEPLSYGGLIQRLVDTAPRWSMEPVLPDQILAAQTRNSRTWDEEWFQALEETLHLLRISGEGLARGAVAVDRPVLEELGAFGPSKGAGHITAAAAIFLASRYASQPQQGLLAAAFARGSDTDTIACLTAALLGALHGPEWLGPLAEQVQDARYITQLTDQVLDERPEIGADRPWKQTDRSDLYRWLETASAADQAQLSTFGEITITSVSDHEARSMFVRSWDMDTEIGQKVQIKRYERGRDGQPRWRPLAPLDATPEVVEAPRAGLILQVGDIARARKFYEEVVGLEIQKATTEYVSFGWLALERTDSAATPAQLELEPPSQGDGQLIRVYVAPKALERARQRVSALGLPVADAHPRFHGRAFRCSDSDGHIVEFVARNGKPPTVSG